MNSSAISKTKFKNYTKCDSYYFLEKNENEILRKYREENKMTDEDLQDFMEVEDLVNRYLTLRFKTQIEKSTNDLKHHENVLSDDDYFTELDYSFIDENNNFNVYEVKATTDKKFLDFTLKPKSDDKFFEYVNGSLYYLGREEFFENQMSEKYFKGDVEKFIKKRNSVESKLFDRYSNIGKYIFDIAYQKKTLIDNERLNIYNSINYNLVIINSKYVHDGSKNYSDEQILDLFTIVNCNNLVEMYFDVIEELSIEYEKNKKNTELDINFPIGKQCKFKDPMYKCPFSDFCKEKNNIDPNSSDTIFNMYRYPETKIFEHLSDEKPVNIKEISPSEFKVDSVQALQTKVVKKWSDDEEQTLEKSLVNDYYDFNSIKQIYNNEITYPIYHLDFEAITHPVPKWYNEKSYMQSVFQYSLHIENSLEEELNEVKKNHFDYLANNSEDPRYSLFKDLASKYDFSKKFTTLVYNKSFEKTRFKEAINIFKDKDPMLCEQLKMINDSIFDLMDLIKGSTKVYENNSINPQEKVLIYKKNFKGSYSIKKVLPSFVPEFSYSDLIIGNGTQAMSGYRSFKQLEQTHQYEKLNDLVHHMKIYCGQDTFAMVLLLRKIVELMRR